MTIQFATEDAKLPETQEEAIVKELAEGGKFEVRKMLNESNSPQYFRFLIIDSHEKWSKASEITGTYNMPGLGGGDMEFPVNGISIGKWEDIENESIIPEWNGEGEPDKDFKAQQDSQILTRKTLAIEAGMGMPIPGDTLEQKKEFLQKRVPGEIDALYGYITQTMCSLMDGILLEDWNELALLKKNSKIMAKKISSWDDWSEADKTKYVFRMHRPSQNYIVEFPINGISAERRKQIEADFPEPTPPEIPDKNPDGTWNPSKLVPNRNDPSWIAKARAVTQRKTLEYLDVCLPFKIPGDEPTERYEWLSDRLFGDVYRLRRYIEDQVIGYSGRYNFFSVASALTS